jgi:hypothetical protein
MFKKESQILRIQISFKIEAFTGKSKYLTAKSSGSDDVISFVKLAEVFPIKALLIIFGWGACFDVFVKV